ncbi:hypothetical protein GCM10008019_25090 [Deinococcus soli (ex Cha et al. 2016)]|jgi:hypothetical protein|nr:hypothetical protein GCM10008019_25090 [Deinococcus soli (ex Cha et al. 2016)]
MPAARPEANRNLLTFRDLLTSCASCGAGTVVEGGGRDKQGALMVPVGCGRVGVCPGALRWAVPAQIGHIVMRLSLSSLHLTCRECFKR